MFSQYISVEHYDISYNNDIIRFRKKQLVSYP